MLKTRVIVGVGLAVVLLAAALVLQRRTGDPVPFGGLWYYDLNTGERVAVVTYDAASPMNLPSGHTGLLARVFTCGQCDQDAFIGYVERFDMMPVRGANGGPTASNVRHLVAAVPEPGTTPKWVALGSPAGKQVVEGPKQRCGEVYRECLP